MRHYKSTFLTIILLALSCLSPLSVISSAEDVNGVAFTSSSISFTPSEPTVGDSVTVSVLLFNTNQNDASVNVEFHFTTFEGGNPDKIVPVTIPAHNNGVDGTITASTTWENIPEDAVGVFVKVEYGGQSSSPIQKMITVQGLPNLIVKSISSYPSSDLSPGDNIDVNVTIENSGTIESPITSAFIEIQGGSNTTVIVSEIQPSQEINVSGQLTVGAEGEWDIIVLIGGDFEESNDLDNQGTLSITINPEPDFFHATPIVISTSEEVTNGGSIEGPWTISGTLQKTSTTSSSTIQMALELVSMEGATLSLQPFNVIWANSQSDTQEWNTQITLNDIDSFSYNTHGVSALIDPLGILPDNSNSNNDKESSVFTKLVEPNVMIELFSVPAIEEAEPGQTIFWVAQLRNDGDVEVSGTLSIEWEGVAQPSQAVVLLEKQIRDIPFQTTASSGDHTAILTVNWNSLSESYDSNLEDSSDSESISVITPFKVSYIVSSESITPAPPLKTDKEYTYSIDVTSQGIGNTTLKCNNKNISLIIDSPGKIVEISCSFKPKITGDFELQIIAENGDADLFTKSWTVSASGNLANAESDSTNWNAFWLLGPFTILLIAILIGAFILTRERDEEIERDIYSYCPSCDGEIEGDEEICPHCDADLVELLQKFHDCKSCNEPIPSVLENCPYCGSQQNISERFEKRSRKEIIIQEKPIEEVEEEDLDEIVTGDVDFASSIKEMGFDEENLETEWDEEFNKAEAEIDTMIAQQTELEESEDTEDTEEDVIKGHLEKTETLFNPRELDDFIGKKDSRRHLKDEDVELTASDAEMRADIYALTGEEGVLPGEEVKLGIAPFTDHRIAGNVIPEAEADFTVEETDDMPLSKEDPKEKTKPKPETKSEDETNSKPEDSNPIGVCEICGADVSVNADSCPTCGVKFE